jgi:MFS family permease
LTKASDPLIIPGPHPYAGWMTVGICFITLALAYGASWYSFSVFLVALIHEFNWSRSVVAGAFAVFMMVHGAIGPFAGNMVDRYGARLVFVLGSLVLAAGFVLSSWVRASWQYYLSFGVVTAMGVGLIGWVPNTTIVQRSFRRKRGLPIGIISSGIGIGIFVCVPLIQQSIDQVGWRVTYRIMALVIPLMIFSMALAFLKKPVAGKSRQPTGELNGNPAMQRRLTADGTQGAWTLRQAVATRSFWLMGSAFFLSSFTTHSILAHQVAYFIEHGLQASSAAVIAGMIGIVSIGAKIFWGALSDRLGREITYTSGMVCSVCGIVFLLVFGNFFWRYAPHAYALFFGLGYAAGAALPPLIAADRFQGQAFGGIFGTLMMLNNAGGACGSWFAGLIYDRLHSYHPAFMIMMVCSLCAAVNIWLAASKKTAARS